MLSYAEYYKRFGTTKERDGWQMANPTGQKVIYVKNRTLVHRYYLRIASVLPPM